MLDAKGSSWQWEDEGTTSADGLQHYSSVRETLAGGCYRIFRKGDVVVTVQDPESESLEPENVNLAQCVDFFEVPDGDEAEFEHMIVVFRWLYHKADPDEGLQDSLGNRDEPSDGNYKLSEFDFFMSRLIEDERNSVDAMVGKALICPYRHAFDDYKERLLSGRKITREALKSGDTSAELNFTESDNVYLCRWYYASIRDRFGSESPDTGRLVALTEEALQYFLQHPSPIPGFIRDELLARFMPRKRSTLGPGHAKKRKTLESSQGRLLPKKRKDDDVKSPDPFSEGPQARLLPKKRKDDDVKSPDPFLEGSQARLLPKKRKDDDVKSPDPFLEGSQARLLPKKRKDDDAKSPDPFGSELTIPRKPSISKSANAVAHGKPKEKIPSRSSAGKKPEKLKRPRPLVQSLPKSPAATTGKAATNASASKIEKPPNSTKRRDDGGSSASVLTKWGITDASSDPEPVKKAAKDMTDHLSSLSPEGRNEVAELWRLLVGQLESIRLDPNGSYTEEEYETAQAKALEDARVLRESRKKNDAALAAFSEGA